MPPFALEIAREQLKLSIHEECDGALEKGIKSFGAGLTTRHSLTSTGPSLWALARRCLDQPVRDLLAECRETSILFDLQGFLPSKITHVPPRPDPRDSDYAIRIWPKVGYDKKTKQSVVDIGLWDLRLHAVIRRCTDAPYTLFASAELDQRFEIWSRVVYADLIKRRSGGHWIRLFARYRRRTGRLARVSRAIDSRVAGASVSPRSGRA